MAQASPQGGNHPNLEPIEQVDAWRTQVKPHALLRGFPSYEHHLSDPLEPLETQLTRLSAAHHTQEQADCWIAIAKGWLTYFQSTEQAARALREAVALDPNNAHAARYAADLCARLAQRDVAAQYAQTWVRSAKEGIERAQAYAWQARLLERSGRREDACAAWQHAIDEDANEPSYLEGLCRSLDAKADPARFATHALNAIKLWRSYSLRRALALAQTYLAALPDNDALANACCECLRAMGLDRAALARWVCLGWMRQNSIAKNEALYQAIALAKHFHDSRLASVLVSGFDLSEVVEHDGRRVPAVAYVNDVLSDRDQTLVELLRALRQGQHTVVVDRGVALLNREDAGTLLCEMIAYSARASGATLSIGHLQTLLSRLGVRDELLGVIPPAAQLTQEHLCLLPYVREYFVSNPHSVVAAQAYLSLCLQHSSYTLLAEALELTLPALNDSPTTQTLAMSAANRLAAFGMHAHAAQFLLTLNEKVLSLDLERLTLAQHYARLASDRELEARVLEQSVAAQPNNRKGAPLGSLAKLYREHRNLVAEVRTLLRILAVSPFDESTLERLSELYATAGEYDRLDAVLALRLEGAQDPDDRLSRALDRAAAFFYLKKDVAMAEQTLMAFAKTLTDNAALVRVAQALVELNKSYEAVRLLRQKAKDATPDSAVRLYDEALRVADTVCGDLALAISVAQDRLHIDPEHNESLTKVGELICKLGDVNLAQRLVEQTETMLRDSSSIERLRLLVAPLGKLNETKTPIQTATQTSFNSASPSDASATTISAPEMIRTLDLLSVFWQHCRHLDERDAGCTNLDLASWPWATEFSAIAAQVGVAMPELAQTPEPGVVALKRRASPILLVGDLTGLSASERCFLFAGALEGVRAQHILCATLADDELTRLLAALSAAFGPADEGDQVEQATAELASTIWRTVTYDMRRTLRECVLELPAQGVSAAALIKHVGTLQAQRAAALSGLNDPAMAQVFGAARGRYVLTPPLPLHTVGARLGHSAILTH